MRITIFNKVAAAALLLMLPATNKALRVTSLRNDHGLVLCSCSVAGSQCTTVTYPDSDRLWFDSADEAVISDDGAPRRLEKEVNGVVARIAICDGGHVVDLRKID